MKTSDYITITISVVSLAIAITGAVRAFMTEQKVSRINVMDKSIEALKLINDLLTHAGDRFLAFAERHRDFRLRTDDVVDEAIATNDNPLIDKIVAARKEALDKLADSEQKTDQQLTRLKDTFNFFVGIQNNKTVDEFTIRRNLTGAYQIYYGMMLMLVGSFQILNGCEYHLSAWRSYIAASKAKSKERVAAGGAS